MIGERTRASASSDLCQTTIMISEVQSTPYRDDHTAHVHAVVRTPECPHTCAFPYSERGERFLLDLQDGNPRDVEPAVDELVT